MTWSKDILKWWRGVPQSHRSSDLHLRKASHEFSELIDAYCIITPNEDLTAKNKRSAIEAADTIIALTLFIEDLGFDAAKTIAAKLEILKNRKWEVQEDGTLQHVKKTP
jgi:hypothetical protein